MISYAIPSLSGLALTVPGPRPAPVTSMFL